MNDLVSFSMLRQQEMKFLKESRLGPGSGFVSSGTHA
jgi:hypothetical protein